MTTATSPVMRCADGTEFPIAWVYDDAPDYEWLRDRSHWPGPMTPMELWLWDRGIPGGDRAWDEVEMVAPPMFRRFQLVGPFLYARMSMEPPERMATMVPQYVAASIKHGGARAFWENYCEPRIMRACDELAAMGPGADLQAAAELLFYGFHQTFTCLAMLAVPSIQLGAMLGEILGEDAELTAFEVTQGGENATQAIDEEIWKLAQLARQSPETARLLASGASLEELRAAPGAAPFVAEFDAMMARHGRRSQGWSLLEETWAERPEAALALVRAEVGTTTVSPTELRERTVRGRREATERVLAVLPEERKAEFEGYVRALDGYVPVREGRAYWQLVIAGAMRGLVLRVGAHLVHEGRLDRADDAFFVTPDDIAGPDADLRALVREARVAHGRQAQLEPAPMIGTPGEVQTQMAERREEFRGAPASRGVVTGTARILQHPDEGSRLQQGEILVCVMTTPAWTPLFSIAGGIVTETGGALSHPAITAREYGIPAVVALQGATTRILDGQTVTIDGAKGTVVVG